jgi:hypothetical protein
MFLACAKPVKLTVLPSDKVLWHIEQNKLNQMQMIMFQQIDENGKILESKPYIDGDWWAISSSNLQEWKDNLKWCKSVKETIPDK